MRLIKFLILFLLIDSFAISIFSGGNLAHAEQRIALVIGNNGYETVPTLEKAANDAVAMEKTLSKIGFEVIAATDVNRREFNRKVEQFTDKIRPGDIALIFYAGHGIEIAGQNFLLPIDIPNAGPGEEEFVKQEAISLDSLIERVKEKSPRVNIMIIDACRDNPFKKKASRSLGSTRGLANVSASSGTFIMYSADAGEAALDNLGPDDGNPNSVFTRTLIPLMQQPGIDLIEMAREARRSVHELAGTVSHQQTPAYYDAILGNFSFVGNDSKIDQKPETPINKPAADKSKSPEVERPAIPKNNEPKPGKSASSQPPKAKELALEPYESGSCDRREFANASAGIQQIEVEICASSVLPESNKANYHPGNLLDGKAETAWFENVEGVGEGERISVEFAEPVLISKIDLLNGYAASEDLFQKNGRILQIEFKTSAGYVKIINFIDMRDWQTITLEDPKPIRWVSFRILNAKIGSRYSDVGMSELFFR